jgi:hypothetical protein
MPGEAYSLTQEWLSADGREINRWERVRSQDGLEGVVIRRCTKRERDGRLVPMVCGLIPEVVTPHKKTAARPAAECRHVVVRQRRDEDELTL